MTAVLDPLYIAVAWVITRIHSAVGAVINPNSGLTWLLTIAILVILMRLILLPLFIKQMHATRKMSALAPQMSELRKRYKNDRQTLNEETMKLYREHGVNPLGGCLPLVAQLPLFFALFGVLRAISGWRLHDPALHGHHDTLRYGLTEKIILSAQHANIFGATISDKFLFSPPGESVQAKLVICAAVVVSVITTYLTVRQSTKRGMTPQMTPDNPMAASQKYMNYIVPLFALSGLYWQFGLVVYWMMTNLWTLGQQYVLFKKFPSLTAPVTPVGSAGPGPVGGRQLTSRPRQGAGGPGQVSGGRGQAAGGARPAQGAQRPPGAQRQGTGAAARPGSTARPGPAARSGAAGGPPDGPAQGSRPGQGNGSRQGNGPGQANGSGQGSRPGQGGGLGQGSRPDAAAAGAKPPGPAEARRQPAAPPRKQAAAAPQPKRPQSGDPAKPDGGRPASAGQQARSNGSGLLRRLGRGRAEPEPEPERPEVRLVRQQRVRQPRSKRSGKR